MSKYNITDYIKDDPELQKAVIGEFLKDIERLEQENEELKAIIEKNNKNTSDLIESVIKHKGKIRNYKQALEEIRSYVNTQLDDFGNDVYGITKNQITTITNKINEVLKDER